MFFFRLSFRNQALLSVRKMSSSTTGSAPEVITEVVNGKGVIKLNRPKALNALNHDMIRQMFPVLQGWNDSGNVDTVLIEGEGSKAFCAGGDVRAITTMPQEKRGTAEQVQFFSDEYRLNHLIGNLKVPYVALIDGITMGGGVGLSVHGQYRVATENTVFAMPETGIGLFPDVGGSFFMPRLKGELGMYLALVGHRLKGQDCYHAGIATHLCPSAQIPDLKKELLNSKPHQIKDILDTFTDKFPDKKPFSLQPDLALIDKVFKAESVEQVMENLKANQDHKLASKALDTLARLSPTSLKVTHRQMSTGKGLDTLKACLEMEFRVVVRCCLFPDFYEGVRALLVDKDNSPKWSPDSLPTVSEDLVDKYFQPLPEELELKL